jgi:hypothetical protein
VNKDLIAAGFLLVGVGVYAAYLFTVRRGVSEPKASPPLGPPPFNPAGAVLVPRGPSKGSDPYTSDPANLPPKWGRYTP